MMIAKSAEGVATQATRDLPSGDYRCPMCESPVILKRGQKVVSHFAHTPDSDCPCAEPESWRHLMAKQVLVEEFTAMGWEARAEIAHPAAGRRVDVGVKIYDQDDVLRYFAIEVQDSTIQVDTMKNRIAADRRIGYDATVWLFTSHRAAALLRARPKQEIRVPDEMLWASNRYGQGIQIIDPETRAIWIAEPKSVHREQDAEFAPSPWRKLKKTKNIIRRPGGFNLSAAPGKFGDKWSMVFCP